MDDQQQKQTGTTATLEPTTDTSPPSGTELFPARGKLFNKDRVGMALTTVRFYDENNDPVGQTLTDASGNYNLDLDKGKYRLEATDALGHVIKQETFSLDSHDNPPLELEVNDIVEDENHDHDEDDHTHAHLAHKKENTVGPTLEEVQQQTDLEKTQLYITEKTRDLDFETTTDLRYTLKDLGIDEKDRGRVVEALEKLKSAPQQHTSPFVEVLTQDPLLQKQVLTRFRSDTPEIQEKVNEAFQKSLTAQKPIEESSMQDGKDTANAADQFLRTPRPKDDNTTPSPEELEQMGFDLAQLQALQERARLRQAQYVAAVADQNAQEQQREILQNQMVENDQRAQVTQEQLSRSGDTQRREPRIERPRTRTLDRMSKGIQKLRTAKKRTGELEKGIQIATKASRVVGILLNPYVFWPIIIIIVLSVLTAIIYNLIVPLGDDPSTENPEVTTEIPGLTLTFTGPPTGTPTSTLNYEVRITYNPPFNSPIPIESITIYYKMPEGTQFISTTGGSDFDNRTNTVLWRLSRPENREGFAFVIQSTRDNFQFTNELYARTGPVDFGSGIVSGDAQSLLQIFEESSQKSGIPIAFLKAIAKKESLVLGFDNFDVQQFSAPNWFAGKTADAPKLEDNDPLIVRGYAYNSCLYAVCIGTDEQGVMQLDIKAWNSIGGGGDRRYIKDNIIGAGQHIKALGQPYDSTYRFSQSPTVWTEQQVKAMARIYCGGSPDADVKFDRLCSSTRNNQAVGYDEDIWDYYREFQLAEGN